MQGNNSREIKQKSVTNLKRKGLAALALVTSETKQELLAERELPRRLSGKQLAGARTAEIKDILSPHQSLNTVYVREYLSKDERAPFQPTGPVPPKDGDSLVLKFGPCINPKCKNKEKRPNLSMYYGTHDGGGTCSKECEDMYLKTKKGYLD